MKVLITAPVRQSVGIFNAYQDALDKLVIPEGVEVDRFFVVNDCPEIVPYIRGSYEICDTGLEYRKTDNDHIWTHDNMVMMGKLRNRTIREMLDGGYDYWFSVDTDLILQPETLVRLLEADRDIVSELFWTDHWCNAWLVDQIDGMPSDWHEPGLYKVGMTGACILVKRRVFEAGVSYTRIPNISRALIGEDRHFCVRAACAGFDLWADSHCPPEHLYTEAMYQDWLRRQGARNQQ